MIKLLPLLQPRSDKEEEQMTVEKRGSFYHYEFMEKVSRRRSPTTVNKEVTLLSSIFIMAIRERVAHGNPCDELPKSVRSKIPARRKRNRYLSVEEERRLFAEGLTGRREHLRAPVEVALYTVMRRGEVLGLRPEHVNFERTPKSFVVKGEAWAIRPGWLLIEKSKNGKPRTIPMSGRVRRVIERLCAEATASGYVLESIRTGRKITDVKRGFTSACLEAEIDNLTFHDLRHTWSTRAAESGVPEHVRRDIMGHSSQSMTGDYTHATPEAMEEAMKRVADYSVNYGKNTEAAGTSLSPAARKL